MMGQYYSRSNPKVIDYLILDTEAQFNELCTRISQHFHYLDVDQDTIIDRVVRSLAYENEAETELGYNCIDTVHNFLGISHHDSSNDICNDLFNFGKHLFDELRRLRAYRNGYLFYQFFKLLGSNIVLVRLIPPEIK